MQKKSFSGTVFILISACLFALGGLCVKKIPWNPMAINGSRNLIALLVLCVYRKLVGHKLRINRAVLFGAVGMTGTNTLYTIATKLTTAANAIILQFTAPIFAILMMRIFFKKKAEKNDLIASAAVFLGIIFFFLDGISSGNQLGNLLALISGVTYAAVFLMNSFPDSDSLSSVFIGQLISVLTGIGFVFRENDFSGEVLVWVGVLGFLQVGVAYICLTKGLESVNAVTASLTSTVEPILNPILVAAFYGEKITGLAIVGAVIVLLSVGVYNVVQAKREVSR